MPRPVFTDTDDLYLEGGPSTPQNILGTDKDSRKSKTFLQDREESAILSKIRRHTKMLTELFRRLHARSHDRPVYEENDDGELVQVGTEPEVLEDAEIWDRYPVTLEWYSGHGEVVGHNVSIGGYSIRAASGLPDDDGKKRKNAPSGNSGGDGQANW